MTLTDIQIEVVKQILDAVNEGMILFNYNNRVVYYNNGFKRMFNIHEDLLQSLGLDCLKEYFSNQLINPEHYSIKHSKILSKGIQISDKFLFKDGRLFNVLITPLKIHGSNYILCSFDEKVNENKYKETLEECYEIFGKLIENVPDFVIIHQGFKCNYINITGAKLLGYTETDELKGMDLKGFLTADAIEILRIAIQNGIELNNKLELKILDRSKDSIWLSLLSTTKLYDEKNIWLSILRDITKEKQIEQMEKSIKERENALATQKKKHQLKYDFYTSMSHETKTPINIILAASRMLKMEIKEESFKGKEYIEIINKNCNKMIRQINNFIDIEKIQTGYFTINSEACNVIQIIEDISLSVLPYANEKDIELIFDTKIEERMAKIDIYLLERVILNLLSNAIKFTNHGGKIHVLIRDLGQEIETSIKDTGRGISQENLVHIFEKFRQAHRKTDSIGGGSGLGLYLVKNLLRLMRGKIFIESEEGKGSSFTVVIPARPIEAGLVAEKSSLDSFSYKEKADIELS